MTHLISRTKLLATTGLLLGGATTAAANIHLFVLPVGNPGNPGIQSGYSGGQGTGPLRICGQVDYEFYIAKFEITAGQYVEFLNAIATDDTYGVYTPNMATSGTGCGIYRYGDPGSYFYYVAPDWENRPVNFVSWGDAARFANWMHNGQPVGTQGASTTEDGAYTLNGAISDNALNAVVRNAGWRWAIPSEDEWFKAAYHQNDGVTGNYWAYPTRTNTPPDNHLLTPDPGNNANYTVVMGPSTIGAPYWRTEVGAFSKSLSPYGAFDMGGNVSEWNEAIMDLSGMGWFVRGARGGDFGGFGGVNYLKSNARMAASMYESPSTKGDEIGFRLVSSQAPCDGDLTGDRIVNLSDVALLLSHYGENGGGYANGDINGDGIIDLSDLATVLAAYGMVCP